MIPDDMLKRLRAKDPELWENVHSRVGTTYDSVGNEIELTTDDLSWDAEEAWLLYCIMRAIRARGWDFSQWTTNGKIQALIRRMPGGYTLLECMHGGEGDSEAEALLLAYLASLEATQAALREYLGREEDGQ